MKGFSLLEIIISISIIGILTAIVTNSYQTSQIKKNQDAIVENIIASLEKAQADTLAGKEGSQYGVKFDTQEFVLFTGTNFDISEPSNQINIINSQFEISTTISNSQNIIYFSKLLGTPNETTTITISHIDNRVDPRSFTIELSGIISMVE
jgi:prepilin-type N-terminal cleavage/methylation domain-containing protein